jgi:hypothetical protein
MYLNLMSQNYVYDSKGTKNFFESEDIDIEFTDSKPLVKIPAKGEEFAAALISMLPTIVDMGFKLTTNILEKRAKKFSAEYTKNKSYLQAGKYIIPNIKFVRTIVLDKDTIPALTISFVPSQVPELEGFVYYIDFIDLKNSSAKVKSNKSTVDYSIEIKPTFLIDKEKKIIELSPLAISSVKFENNTYPPLKHRTDIIPLPNGAILTEISLKIVESNPLKVRAEKILSVWNTYKDDTKTIINNILPKEKEDESSSSKPSGGNTSTGNEE